MKPLTQRGREVHDQHGWYATARSEDAACTIVEMMNAAMGLRTPDPPLTSIGPSGIGGYCQTERLAEDDE